MISDKPRVPRCGPTLAAAEGKPKVRLASDQQCPLATLSRLSERPLGSGLGERPLCGVRPMTAFDPRRPFAQLTAGQSGSRRAHRYL